MAISSAIKIVPNSAKRQVGSNAVGSTRHERPEARRKSLEPAYGFTPKQINDYAKTHTEQRRHERHQRRQVAQMKKEEIAAAQKQPAANVGVPPTHLNQAAYKAGKYTSRRIGTKIGDLKTKIAAQGISVVAQTAINSWWLTGQMYIFATGMSVFFFAVAVGAALSIPNEVINFFTGKTIPAAELLSLLAVGIGAFNFIMCCSIMAGILLAYKLAGVKSLHGRFAPIKFCLFTIAIIGYFPLFFQFAPWGLGWVWFVNRFPD